jgi:hypothetical protein
VFFLNIVGVPYPDVDVDQVRELADSAREFAVDIRATFDAATGTLDDMGSAMSGDSYQAIIAGWAYHYDRLTELDDAFEVAATALDIAADVIEAIQIAVLIELAALAASFIAGMFTPAGPVTGPMIAAAARYIAKEMAKAIMWYLAAEVAAKAIEPLVERFNRFIREALQPPEIPLTTTGSGKYYLDPDEVERYSRLLDRHADDLLSHGEKFGEKLDTFDFRTPGLGVEPIDWSDPANMPAPVDGNPPVMAPSIPPGVSPVPSPPITSTYPGDNQDTDPSARGGPRDETSSDPRTAQGAVPTDSAVSSSDPNRSPAVSPEVAASTTPGTAPGSAPSSAGGVQPSGTEVPGRDGSAAESRTTVSANTDHRADQAQSVPHRSGDTAVVVPPGTTQASPTASGQSQAAPAASGQRPAEAGAGKAQGGAGREGQRPDAAAGKGQGGPGRGAGGTGPGTQQPAARMGSKTPWSRAGGKAARAGSTAKRPDVEAPAVSGRPAADNGDAVRAAPPASDTPQQTVPQVFAPDTAAPPLGAPSATGTGDNRTSSAEPPSKDADESAVGARPPSK